MTLGPSSKDDNDDSGDDEHKNFAAYTSEYERCSSDLLNHLCFAGYDFLLCCYYLYPMCLMKKWPLTSN